MKSTTDICDKCQRSETPVVEPIPYICVECVKALKEAVA